MGTYNKNSGYTGSTATPNVNGGNHGSAIGHQALDVAGQVKHEAAEIVTKVKTEAADMVTTRVARRQEQSAMELTSIANVLREKGEELDGSLFAPIIGRAADQMDRASDYLKDASLKDVVRSTESLARREPLLFIGGAFTLGVLCARFLRSSAHHEQAEQPSGVNAGGTVRW